MPNNLTKIYITFKNFFKLKEFVMNKSKKNISKAQMTNEQRLGQLQTYLSYFTTVDDYSQLKGEQKSQFDTILEFAKAVATHLKLNIQDSSNGTIGTRKKRIQSLLRHAFYRCFYHHFRES